MVRHRKVHFPKSNTFRWCDLQIHSLELTLRWRDIEEIHFSKIHFPNDAKVGNVLFQKCYFRWYDIKRCTFKKYAFRLAVF